MELGCSILNLILSGSKWNGNTWTSPRKKKLPAWNLWQILWLMSFVMRKVLFFKLLAFWKLNCDRCTEALSLNAFVQFVSLEKFCSCLSLQATHKCAWHWDHQLIWMTMLLHPPYCFDLTLSDFHMFLPFKYGLQRHLCKWQCTTEHHALVDVEEWKQLTNTCCSLVEEDGWQLWRLYWKIIMPSEMLLRSSLTFAAA